MAVAASRQEEPSVPAWSDPDACHVFLSKNLGLIWDVIRRRCGFLLRGHQEALRRQGEAFYTDEDAFAAGFFGLRNALRRYDSSKGAFSTYAEGEIYAAIRADRYKCPDNVMYISPVIYRDARELAKKEERTLHEEMRLKHTRRILKTRAQATVHPEPGEGVEDAANIEPPDHAVEQGEELVVLRDAVRRKLTTTERRIYRLRYEECLSLEAASARMGIDRLRLRAAEAEILRKLTAARQDSPEGTGAAT